VALHQQAGDRYGEAAAWDSLGYAHHRAGRHARAVDCYRCALDLIHDIGDRYNEAYVLEHLGDTHLAVDQPGAARADWTRALTILTELQHPAAQGVRDKLDRLCQGSRPAPTRRATASTTPTG
jgi:tetratricopeptide (TPR) repeat protein